MIRPAVDTDLPRLIEMGRAFNMEAGYSEDVPFCERSFGRVLAALMKAGLVLVVDKGFGAVGMAAADVAPSICNDKVLLSREAFWYVEPAHRPEGSGGALLNALEALARDFGAHIFDVVAEEGKRSKALARLYQARHFSPAEITFRKRLN